MVTCKSRNEIQMMRQAGRVVGLTLDEMAKHAKPGITALELDKIAEEFIRSHDCYPTFKGYDPAQRGYDRSVKGYDGYKYTICISFNEEIVHGIPSKRLLKDGDIVSIDVGATYKGWVGDAARTFMIGNVSDKARKLVEVTQQSLLVGIAQMKRGNHLFDISAAINEYVAPFGFSLVREYGGHGVGRIMHEDPHLPNVRQPKRGMELRKGMCLAIEPMVMLGKPDVVVMPDKWTVVTKDHSLAAHFEHTSAVTDGEPEILTLA